MRTFIAIEFPKEIKDYLTEVQERVRPGCKTGNFSKQENFHLTLRFLGEVSSSEIPDISEAVAEAAAYQNAFSLTFGSLGQFPKEDKSVLWVGIEDNKALIHLHSCLEKSLSKQGFSKDRKGLSPHITLAREASFYNRFELLRSKAKMERKSMDVNFITLMESVRQGSRLIYRPIFKAELKNNKATLSQN